MASRGKARADRIRAEVPIHKILMGYGYAVHSDMGDREEQFSCDLHGGHDNTPSARFYPASNSWHCFACGRTRDPVQTVMEKDGIGFWDALKKIETVFKLPQLPWESDQEQKQDIVAQVGDAFFGKKEDFQSVSERVERMLHFMKVEVTASWMQILTFWSAWDRIHYGVRREGWSEGRSKKLMEDLLERIRDVARSEYAEEGQS